MSNYAVGSNLLGYLPEGDVHVYGDAASAKQALIDELEFSEDYAESEEIAEEFCHAAEDANLMSVPFTIVVNGTAYWVQETDEEPDE